MLEQLESLARKYEELTHLLAQPEVVADYSRLQAISKERASLEPLVSKYQEYKKTLQRLEETRSLLEDNLEEDLEALAREELSQLKERCESLKEELRQLLLPKDPRDEKDVIMEIRAGAGGEEAGLFAADLFRMYTRYAQRQGWQVEVMSSNESGVGGFKEVIFEVKGKGAFSRLKFESGVHRVQRIPVTEASGRLHTSTATVAVLPEAEEVEAKISPEDLRIDIFHASGHGGQNVQKVSTAVRIVHLPTGITATCQDERSQLRNKTKAMAVLRARFYDLEQRKQQNQITGLRRAQVGSGERAEKSRTYNFPQNRVTDHRLGLAFHNLDRILEGELDDLIEALGADLQTRQLAEAKTV